MIRPSSIKSAPDGPGFAGLNLNCTVAPGIARDSSSSVTWAENALFVIGKEITGWQRSKNVEVLLDSEIGAETLLEIVKELKRRSS